MDDYGKYHPMDNLSPLFYDEERKRFTNFTAIFGGTRNRIFSSFTSQRPDMYGGEYKEFFMLPVYAWRVLHTFQKIRAFHYNQLHLTYCTQTLFKAPELGEDYIKRHDFADYPIGIPRLWHWDDSTRMYHWMQLNLFRIKEYGMDIPLFYTPGITKKDIQRTENELTEYFIKEMSKRPYAPKNTAA